MPKISQNDRILAHLKAGGTITPIEALDHMGCFRLAGRISDLKKQGHNIHTEMVTQDGKSFARYSLLPKNTIREDFYMSTDAVKQHEWSRK